MKRYYIAALTLMVSINVAAELKVADDVTITQVVVNGGADSPNSGTTCLKKSGVLEGTCNGFIAIRNNNNQLLSAALHAKATGGKVWMYYANSAGTSNHCPGKVFTPCAVSSIGLK